MEQLKVMTRAEFTRWRQVADGIVHQEYVFYRWPHAERTEAEFNCPSCAAKCITAGVPTPNQQHHQGCAWQKLWFAIPLAYRKQYLLDWQALPFNKQEAIRFVGRRSAPNPRQKHD